MRGTTRTRGKPSKEEKRKEVSSGENIFRTLEQKRRGREREEQENEERREERM